MDINKNIKDINSNIKGFNSNITNIVKSKLPLQLQYILGVYFLGLFFMMLYRFANFAIHCFVSFSDINPVLLIRSLLVGIRFDTIVMCWMLAVFLVLMALGAVFNINKKWYYRPIHLIVCIVFVFAYFIIAFDLAYFTYFRSHINIIALSWIQSPSYIGSLVLRHPSLLMYFAVFMFSLAWYIWLMYCLYNATLFKVIPPYKQERNLGKTIILSVVIIGLCGLGMYGRITEKKPLSISSAYFSDSDFFNQLAVSPLFNLEKSIEEESFSTSAPLTVVDGLTTRKTVEEEFILKHDRPALCPTLPGMTNIVMIMLEDITLSDITARKMPNLASLSSKSLSFTNVYPDGEYDYNGVFATLFAYPNILSANSMSSTIIPLMNGISSTLADNNYNNLFFTTYSQKNNNAIRFLYRNKFDRVIAKKDITVKEETEEISKQTNNFFACILISKDTAGKVQKTADNYIKQFINYAKQTPWYASTLFVITGCNGKDKIPLIFYMPKQIKPSKNDNLASQTDIAPTLLAMIDGNYKNNNTLGHNIFANNRSFAVSSYPHSAIAQDSVWKYVWRDSGQESLYYNGSDKEGINYIKVYSEQAEKMKTYLFSMLQFTQYSVSQMKMQRK